MSDSAEAEDNAALGDLDEDNSEEHASAEDDIEDQDEIDSSVEENDAAIIDEVAAEENDLGLPKLSRAEANLGCFAVTKVISYFTNFCL
jgi:hypothetical protein